jgi:hypothetical protein
LDLARRAGFMARLANFQVSFFAEIIGLNYSIGKRISVFLIMKFAKLLAAAAVVVFAAVLAFMLVGLVMNIVWYLFVFALIGAAGYAAYRLLAGKSDSKQLGGRNDAPLFEDDFERADRLLNEYKKKLSLKQ